MTQNAILKRVFPHLLASVNPDRVSERGAEMMRVIETGTVADLGMNSVEAVAFLKRIGDEFGVEIPLDEAATWKNLGDMTAYLDR